MMERGLSVPDAERAVRYVRHIGYYRLSPYALPFQDGSGSHRFRPGTEFDDVLSLYVFDRSLRLLVMDALERIEVAVRAAVTDHMSNAHQDAHWYTRDDHFGNVASQHKLLSTIRGKCDERLRGTPETMVSADGGTDGPLHYRSALEHYLLTYGEPELPPSWIMVELLTLGQLSHLFRNLGDRRDQTAIAQQMGITAPLLESWLRTYTRVRNICAHHGRLWNVGLGVYPKIPTSGSIPWTAQNAMGASSRKRLYPVLVSMQSLLSTISPHSTWGQRLEALLEGCPEMYRHGMGMPPAWHEDPLWTEHQ